MDEGGHMYNWSDNAAGHPSYTTIALWNSACHNSMVGYLFTCGKSQVKSPVSLMRAEKDLCENLQMMSVESAGLNTAMVCLGKVASYVMCFLQKTMDQPLREALELPINSRHKEPIGWLGSQQPSCVTTSLGERVALICQARTTEGKHKSRFWMGVQEVITADPCVLGGGCLLGKCPLAEKWWC